MLRHPVSPHQPKAEWRDKFKGKLQLVHGTMDDNVHMQNSIQFVSALEDKGKDFEFMLYPGGRHGWGWVSRWQEE